MGRTKNFKRGTVETEVWQTVVGLPYVRVTIGFPLFLTREGRAALRRSNV